MKKLNGYAAMIMAFMAGMALMSGHEHNVLLCISSLIFSVSVANDWGFGGVDEDDATNPVSESVRKRSQKKGA